MSRNYLRPVAYISLFLIILILGMFTDWDQKLIFSIALIGVFLILFTYIFATEGPVLLNVAIIITAFIGLPMFLMMYLDIPNSLPGIWGGILVGITVIIFGILAIVTIAKLNFVEIRYGE